MYAIKAIYAILFSSQVNDLESWELGNMTAKTPLMSLLDSSVANSSVREVAVGCPKSR